MGPPGIKIKKRRFRRTWTPAIHFRNHPHASFDRGTPTNPSLREVLQCLWHLDGALHEPRCEPPRPARAMLPASHWLPPAAAPQAAVPTSSIGRRGVSTEPVVHAELRIAANFGHARVSIVPKLSSGSHYERQPMDVATAVVVVARVAPAATSGVRVRLDALLVLTGSSSSSSSSSMQGRGGPLSSLGLSSASSAHARPTHGLHTAAPSAAFAPTAAPELAREPAPSEPAASEPAPSEPAASEPAPSEPAASEPAAASAAGPKKKRLRKKQSFHPATKRGGPKHTGATRSRVKRGLYGSVDLDVTGQTHRAYSNASNAVRNRKPPQKPPERKKGEEQTHEQWLAAQMALTAEMSAKYEPNAGSKRCARLSALLVLRAACAPRVWLLPPPCGHALAHLSSPLRPPTHTLKPFLASSPASHPRYPLLCPFAAPLPLPRAPEASTFRSSGRRRGPGRSRGLA